MMMQCVCVCGQQPRVACLQYERSVSFSFKSQITERKVCALQPWPTATLLITLSKQVSKQLLCPLFLYTLQM